MCEDAETWPVQYLDRKKIHNCFADLVMGDDGHEMRLTAVPTIVMLHVELRSIVSAKVRVLRSVFGYFRHQCIRAVGCQNPQNKFHPHSVGWLDRLENSKDSCRIGVLVCSSQRVADQSQSDRSYGRSRSESGGTCRVPAGGLGGSGNGQIWHIGSHLIVEMIRNYNENSSICRVCINVV